MRWIKGQKELWFTATDEGKKKFPTDIYDVAAIAHFLKGLKPGVQLLVIPPEEEKENKDGPVLATSKS